MIHTNTEDNTIFFPEYDISQQVLIFVNTVSEIKECSD
jgi:hypothetical protein